MKAILIGLLLFSTCVLSEITAVGGRFYLEVNGERLDKYYTTSHTAMVAGMNRATVCNCEVIIVTPDITVNVVDDLGTLEFSWSTPVKREDGTNLLEEEIEYYVLTIYGSGLPIEIQTSSNSYRHILPPGMYTADIYTVASEQAGPPSPKIEFTII